MKIKCFLFCVMASVPLCACNAIFYTVEFDSHGGSKVNSQIIKHGGKVAEPNAPTRNGYEFVNWTYNGEPWSFTGYVVTNGLILDANWNINTYSIAYNLDGGTNDPTNPTSYTVEDNKELKSPVKEHYTFLGWYSGENKIESISKGMYGNLSLDAHWTINTHNVTVSTTDSSKGNVTGGGIYAYNSNVTITATPATDYLFKGWYTDSECKSFISGKAQFSFIMPENDVTYYAKFWSQAEHDDEAWKIAHGVKPGISSDGKTITYGMYPQTNINDPTLIAALNTLTNPNEFGYYLYDDEYYYKYTATPYESGYTFDNGDAIVNGTAYWFKVEAIKWTVLDNEGGTYFITSQSLLVNRRYNEYYNGDPISKTDYQGNTGDAYANNYKYSEIRSWLNTDFFDQAFFLDNDNIKVSTIDNSPESTLYVPNQLSCEDTTDKLFLLSAKELTTAKYGFNESKDVFDAARRCKPTDYGRSHGAYVSKTAGYEGCDYFYTRSPNRSVSYVARRVVYSGDIDYDDYVNFNQYGVRPALRLTLDPSI